MEECVDESEQRTAKLQAVAAEADRRRSGTRGREPWPRQWRGHDGVDEYRGRKFGVCIENRDGRRLQPRSLPSSQGWCTSFARAGLSYRTEWCWRRFRLEVRQGRLRKRRCVNER